MGSHHERTIDSLERLCLVNIADDIQNWCKDSENDDLSKYKYILGPFDVLHTKQIHQLLSLLSAKKLLRSSYLHLLLHHNISGIDLSLCSHLVNDTLLRALMSRCKKITWLNLTNCTKVTTRTLTQIPANFPKLWSLSLNHISACKDSVLEQLGQHCRQLQVLYINRCSVTDKGLQGLCGTPKNPRCSKLCKVDISETSVTGCGVELLLQTQPQLMHLLLHDVFSFQGINPRNTTQPVSNLRSIDLSHLDISDEDFNDIVQVCPSLSDINIIHCKNLTDKSLNICQAKLSKLEHFRAGCSANPDFTFHGLSRLLATHGKHLKTLDISDMEDIDMKIIILNCCSLETLLLDSCHVQASFVSLQTLKSKWGNQINQELLKKGHVSLCDTNPRMKHLSLNSVHVIGDNLSTQLEAVLNNSKELRQLDLSFVSGVTDEILDSFIETSDVHLLEELKLVGCSDISGSALIRVIELCVNLKILNVCSCKSVTRRDYDAMVQLVKDSYCKLTVKWS